MQELRRRWPALVLAFLLALASLQALAAGVLGANAMRAKFTSLGPQLAKNAFGGPLVLESEEAARRIEGDVYAVLDHPFAAVSAALTDPGQWCDILILHLNTKYCRRTGSGADTVLEVRVGRKVEQSLDAATPLRFKWKPPAPGPDYFATEMGAPEGPYSTRDYRLLAEAVPLEGNKTLLHMGYALSYGSASYVALQLYLGTTGRDKVGFTPADAASGGEDGYIGGMRGVTERNTMRYYLAIDAYLRSLALPPPERLERRLAAWFDATEKYPRQLHEVEREDYLKMKRNEVRRQTAAR